jgi:hypothetical protein
MTKPPETDIGASGEGMITGMGDWVSRLGIRPRAVSVAVHTLAVGSSDADDDRSLAPFFPLSHLLFLLSDAAPNLKKARSLSLSSSLARE